MFCECVARFVGKINPPPHMLSVAYSYSILTDSIKIYLLSMTPVTRMINRKPSTSNLEKHYAAIPCMSKLSYENDYSIASNRSTEH